MFTCRGGERRLPQNDLAYVGFRLAVRDTLTQRDRARSFGDEVPGYLSDAAVLDQVAPAAQVDLLADAWRRHRAEESHEVSLLDAAVLHAAFGAAGRLIDDSLDRARSWLRHGPRRVRPPSERTRGRLIDLFFRFWEGEDSPPESRDPPPEQADPARDFLNRPEETTPEMEAFVKRRRAAPAVLADLQGLLTVGEIDYFACVLTPHWHEPIGSADRT